MTAYTFLMPAQFDGPGGCTVEGSLEVGYDYQRPDPDVGMPGGIVIESVVILIGTALVEYDGSYHDDDLLQACRDHYEDKKEAAECEHADYLREQRREVQQ